jgi:dihydropyrimidinase
VTDLVIRNGTVVREDGVDRMDVAVTGGRISAIGRGLSGARTIDADGLIVLPGGVDNHCHIEQPVSKNGASADTFATATASAAVGGTTSIVCFARQAEGETLARTVEAYREKASRSVVDHAFHVMIIDPRPEVLADELPAVVADGARSIKIFTAYDGQMLPDPQILDVLAVAKRTGAMVAVHAENHAAIKFRLAELLAAGRTDAFAHAESRPGIVEAEAVRRMITLSETAGHPVHLFHVTCDLAAEEIRRARARGVRVYSETCTHYLALTEDVLKGPMAEVAGFVCSPPMRPEADRRAVWRHLIEGTLDMVSSDHSSFRMDDPMGKLKTGPDTPFDKVANGMPGLATRLPVLFDMAVSAGRIGLERFARLTATNPAKLYGLYPRKGAVAVGADADLALWDPTKTVTLRGADLVSRAGYTPYEGRTVTGWPVLVLSRGEVVARDGRPEGAEGRGEYLPRGAYAWPELH